MLVNHLGCIFYVENISKYLRCFFRCPDSRHFIQEILPLPATHFPILFPFRTDCGTWYLFPFLIKWPRNWFSTFGVQQSFNRVMSHTLPIFYLATLRSLSAFCDQGNGKRALNGSPHRYCWLCCLCCVKSTFLSSLYLQRYTEYLSLEIFVCSNNLFKVK